MTPTTQHELLEKLTCLWELSPDVRFDQLLANLGFLVEDQTDRSIWDIEDEQLLRVMDWHRVELSNRLGDGAYPRARPTGYDGLTHAELKRPG